MTDPKLAELIEKVLLKYWIDYGTDLPTNQLVHRIAKDVSRTIKAAIRKETKCK